MRISFPLNWPSAENSPMARGEMSEFTTAASEGEALRTDFPSVRRALSPRNRHGISSMQQAESSAKRLASVCGNSEQPGGRVGFDADSAGEPAVGRDPTHGPAAL
jgi:hypothetical protein